MLKKIFFLLIILPMTVSFTSCGSAHKTHHLAISETDYLMLGEDGRIFTVNLENSVLKTAAPSAFGFLSDNPEYIAIEGIGSAHTESNCIRTERTLPEGEIISIIRNDSNIPPGVSSQGEDNIYILNGRFVKDSRNTGFQNSHALTPWHCSIMEHDIGAYILKKRDGLPPRPDSLLVSP